MSFTDLAGNLHAADVTALGQLGVLDSTSGAFKPDAPILRRDFVRWLFKTNNAIFANAPSKVVHPAASDEPSSFKDLPASDRDFQYVQGLADAGVSVGFPDKRFRPDVPITREQAIAVKSGLDFGGVDTSYAKDPAFARYQLPSWKDKANVSVTFVAALATDVVLEGDKTVNNIGRTFGAIAMLHPQATLTRGEAATMFQVIGGHNGSNDAYDNAHRTVAGALNPSPSPSP